jgi:capsule biosynthesis phosphatase
MFVIIPLGGIGERFKENGYSMPKGLIKVFGKPVLYYLLDTLVSVINIDFIYIPYNKEYSLYRFEDLLRKDYPTLPFKFFPLMNNTGGAAETLHIALRELTCDDKSFISLDGDNFYTCNILSNQNIGNTIVTVEDLHDNPIYSYLQIENNRIIGIMEKQKISNYACTGAYGFSSYKQFLTYTQYVIANKLIQKGEYYISNVIQAMIEDGIEFKYSLVDIDHWHCLGTPTQVKQFCNNFSNFTFRNRSFKKNKLRVCFDLDNTLVTFPKIKNDYTSVVPIPENITFLQYLKHLGHTIIIYTARRMKTHTGNTGKIMRDIGKCTFDTLEQFNIPYDELYFGKPNADIYIDDLALNCYDNLEKSLGIYMDTIQPRDFNEIRSNTIEIYTKRSHDLTGEINYYENIPKLIKTMFPIFIEGDVKGTWYTMEKVDGLTASIMYLSEIMTKDNLKYIMDSLEIIHSVTPLEDKGIDIPIYANYCEKLKKRYKEYDYSSFPNSQELYESLYTSLHEYERLRKGRVCCIHGDAVMSNILLNNHGKIKFIDMRGKLGSMITIYGDWLYDWAKLYQSLIGYDKILLGKNVSRHYEIQMKEFFESYFIQRYSIEDFKHLKTVTKSLLFSLIPIHNNSKCREYYSLIQTIHHEDNYR